MAATYKGLLTNNGKALIASATINNKINYSHIAVGDGNGSVPNPLETRTALVNEKARIALNVVEINPNNTNQIICEAIIPSNLGGFYIRELGLYAGATMVVNASYPPTYKPLEDEGGAREIAIKLVINIQNAEVIALYLDDSLIYATRAWVDTNYIRRNELVDNLTTNDAKKALSAKQGKLLSDVKINRGEAFKDAFSSDIDYYVDRNSGSDFGFTSCADFPIGTRILVSSNLNFADYPTIDPNFVYIETKKTFDNPGRQQVAYGYNTGLIAIRVAGTGSTSYGLWNYIAFRDSNITGNAVSASKLQNPRTIFGQTFDGTADIGGTVTASTGVVASDANHYIDFGRYGIDRINFAVPGAVFNFMNSSTGEIVARITPNGIDCNAATASKLKTPIKINDVVFDGATDINLPFIGFGQTWHDVSASRLDGVTYTNPSPRWITVFFGGGRGMGDYCTFFLNGENWAQWGGSESDEAYITVHIPPGATYGYRNKPAFSFVFRELK